MEKADFGLQTPERPSDLLCIIIASIGIVDRSKPLKVTGNSGCVETRPSLEAGQVSRSLTRSTRSRHSLSASWTPRCLHQRYMLLPYSIFEFSGTTMSTKSLSPGVTPSDWPSRIVRSRWRLLRFLVQFALHFLILGLPPTSVYKALMQLKACSILTNLRFLLACCRLSIALKAKHSNRLAVDGHHSQARAPFVPHTLGTQGTQLVLSWDLRVAHHPASPLWYQHISVGAWIYSPASCLDSHTRDSSQNRHCKVGTKLTKIWYPGNLSIIRCVAWEKVSSVLRAFGDGGTDLGVGLVPVHSFNFHAVPQFSGISAYPRCLSEPNAPRVAISLGGAEAFRLVGVAIHDGPPLRRLLVSTVRLEWACYGGLRL
ncbi:hypothetical protein BDM02DRAFT_1626188 [Thelephora ganbajun]|uniref:Uncharacterized protein n=1 Tax=Thelephora ganbajun TaxID=370292 RepID=A0ACB6ZVU8_THEGA|nr:hypothetical protein BDM02DRAFT_1626188 [Thelephora ganbajun]